MRGHTLSGLYRALAHMLEAGVALPEALSARATSPLETELARRVAEGEPFSTAISGVRGDLPLGHERLIAIGERSGRLSSVLRHLADARDTDRRTASRLVQAAAYPLLVIAMLLIVSAAFAGWVLPTLADLVAAFDPAGSSQVRRAARVLSVLTPAALGAIVAGVGALALGRHGGRRTDEMILRAPLAGGLLRARRLSLLFLALEAGTAGGASLEDAMEAAAGVVPGPAFAAACRHMAAELRAGRPAAQVFGSCRLFPPTVSGWLSASDAGVPLWTVAGEARARFEAELDENLEWLVRIAEPLLIVTAGVALAAFVGVAVLPVLSVYGELL